MMTKETKSAGKNPGAEREKKSKTTPKKAAAKMPPPKKSSKIKSARSKTGKLIKIAPAARPVNSKITMTTDAKKIKRYFINILFFDDDLQIIQIGKINRRFNKRALKRIANFFNDRPHAANKQPLGDAGLKPGSNN